LKLAIDGAEIKTLKRKSITSTNVNNIKQKMILLIRIRLADTGEEINPPIVPESFSLTNSFVII
jgi:hypothetical protein